MESEVLREMHGRIVKSFLDILILIELRRSPMSGHDVVVFIHRKFHILISSGTVYSHLYSLERKELVEGRWIQKKRIYKLTKRGRETVEAILNWKDKILGLFLDLFIG